MQLADLIGIRDAFISEMDMANHGQKSSLPFIKNQLPNTPHVQIGEQFQAIIIGGTIYQTALFRRTAEGNEIIERNKGNLPLMTTKEVFLDFITGLLHPEITVIAVNFAYPLQPVFTNQKLDGQLVWGSKEHQFQGLIGHRVGQTIEEYVKLKQRKDVLVSIANDTICLLLSGLQSYPWSELGCGVVGTGVNFATFLDEHTAINLESGEFDKFEVSDAVAELDRKSVVPGSALLEKECSGAYIFQKYNIALDQQGIDAPPITQTEELDAILLDQNHPGQKLAAQILDYSAQITAVQISAIMEWHKKNMTFSMAGSLFWKAHEYKENVERYIKQLSPNYQVTFINNTDADLIGAARLVT